MDPILDKLCKDFRLNEKALLEYERGKDNLILSGVLHLLRRVASPKLQGIRGDAQSLATEAAFSNGYHQCIDDILYFKERFLMVEEKPQVNPQSLMDFGAKERLLKNNILTEKELNGIK